MVATKHLERSLNIIRAERNAWAISQQLFKKTQISKSKPSKPEKAKA